MIRGLFVGGTLASEAALIAGHRRAGHTFVDFGDDEYTDRPRAPDDRPDACAWSTWPAPAADPATGVLLLDVVLGHGAEPDPAALLAPAIAGVDQPVVVAVVGTDGDPQGRDRQVARAGRRRRRGAPVQRRRHPPRPRAAGRPRMSTPEAVVNVGADLLADAVADQAAPVTRVDWRPPMPGTEADLATVAADPLRRTANERALAAMLGVTATLVDVAPASRGARPAARRVPARRPADRVGPRVRPAARRR